MTSTTASILAILAVVVAGCQGFTNVYPKLKSRPVARGEDAGEPLFLTPLIEGGKIDEARKASLVQHMEMKDVGSYAGYLTVNKEYNSNLFFWFFPAAEVYYACIHFVLISASTLSVLLSFDLWGTVALDTRVYRFVFIFMVC